MSALLEVIRSSFIVHRKKQNVRATNDKRQTTNQPGFTLIELMIAIIILSILAGIGLITYNNLMSKVNESKIQQDFVTIKKAVDQARLTRHKTLAEITDNYWTEGYCIGAEDISTDTNCINAMKAAWAKILPDTPLPFDPWGNPYTIDENEGESFGGNTCEFRDEIHSAGPNHKVDWDDYCYDLPFFTCPTHSSGCPYHSNNPSPIPSPGPNEWITTANVVPTTVPLGTSFTVNASVTAPSAYAALIDVEIYDPSQSYPPKFQEPYDNETFTSGQTKNYSKTFTSLSPRGIYTVKIGIFGANWNGLLNWNDNAFQFTVN